MTTADIIPAYPYVQFADDENISAWFDAFNTYAQQYLDWFNDTPLFDYTNTSVQGTFLDWMAAGVYGCYRTPIPYGNVFEKGPLNTYTPNYMPFNTREEISDLQSYTMTDDVFRRVITWNFYKGDGTQITIPWLKKRIARWMGLDWLSGDVSVKVSSGNTISVIVAGGSFTTFSYLSNVVSGSFVNLPFGYTFDFSYISKDAFDSDFGGDIL